MKSADLKDLKVICAEDVEAAARSGAKELLIRENAVFTPSAQDLVASHQMKVSSGSGSASTTPATPAAANVVGAGTQWEKLFFSPEAEAIKAEIVHAGHKLWHRQYVDGNGGNISYRIGEDAVICTPTLMSKGDLTPADLCIVDLKGTQLYGARPRTSEILLHLEIYKAVPAAKGVVHCHPPHATAYAITGRVPPNCVIPEYEVFVGSIAVSPYETPGTQKFAETVIPYVRTHNTVLLGNHGIVCWADTVTHAEWYAEVVETYCHTLLIASQLGAPISQIPGAKATDLLAIKQKLGIPDARFDLDECQVCDIMNPETPISLPPRPGAGGLKPPAAQGDDMESLVQSVADAVLAALNKKTS
ncbi:MAG: class II aldolase/adducin family protein [Acidobacteria bacterium]|nr:class II aldolase/adducin family protein [Acidobacteriota bacterium]